MKNPKKAVISLSVLGAILGVSFILPKAVQTSEKFQPLADQMSSNMPAPKEVELPHIVLTDIPSPTAVVQKGQDAVTPASNEKTKPSGPDPVMLIQTALAAGDHSKASTYLDLAKERIDASTFTELSNLVKAATERAKQQAEASAKAAAAAQAAKADPQSAAKEKALADSQATLAQTLKQLQDSQAETNRLVAEMRQKKTTELADIPASVVKTASAADVDPNGVAVKFALNSSVLDQAEADKLGSMLTTLNQNSGAKVQLRGYADKSGNSEYNLSLSKARALSVKETLQKSGIQADRIEVMPLGSFAAPANAKAEDLRKVEVVLVK
jgi:outer membrane protein OmpA-like peptidoglycan-associated protein